MKIAKSLAVAVAALASLPLMAQQVNATAQQSGSASAGKIHANESAQAGAHANVNRSHPEGRRSQERNRRAEANRENAHSRGSAAGALHMRPVNAELQHKLDSKSARVGQRVVLKTTEKMKTADGTVIPRGSRLIGHITEVHAHTRGHEASSMAIAFDRVMMKHGQSLAIHSMIESVRPSAAALAADSMENNDSSFAGPPSAPMGGGMAGGGAMAGGAAGMGHAGGGLVGGGAGVVGGATSAVGAMGHAGAMGNAGAGLNSAAGGALNAGGNAVNTTGRLAGNAAAGLRHGVYGSANAAGALGTHATAIPGVMLNSSSSAAGDASGMFTAAKKNIRLDSGTQMVVGIVAAH